MAEVVFDGVCRRYGATLALDRVSLTAPDRMFTVLCGPPGCGKSVLLRLLVGLETPDAGRVLIDGQDVTDMPPARRPVGYVPQSFALYPHLSVRDNIAYPLRLARAPAARIREQVARVAELLSIGHLLDKTPDTLSGGEKQRVAVARGLSREARVFVLDDPLVGLDYKLRERLMADLKTLGAELGATFLYAASDPLETLTMAQRLAVLEGGRLVQAGPVEEVYAEPAAEAALRLVGFPRANLLAGRRREGVVEAGPLRFAAGGPDGEVLVGLRPEAAGPPGRGVAGEGVVTLVEDLGAELVVYLDCAGEALTLVRLAEEGAPAIGTTFRFGVDPADLMLFDRATGLALGRARGREAA
ncbi:ABC transporter ATP-binding protein [Rubellimicrobium sp. CFH 75288]|uniref:ABC transporter ATP-binding protein n=1 Tax=Rubellimicrobium sp. CFH 75288 TaxID=2697034 RepID=UPI0014134940|nr:ABC transporter ATP-binding protein [Rubellimicrobium sp. CFH 75288]NAZ37867.1 ATP-binding cassette domain-containing protein [Rubellimicrobium sp. CFH 75288]